MGNLLRPRFLVPAAAICAAAIVVVVLIGRGPAEDFCIPGDAGCEAPPPPCPEAGSRDLNPDDTAVAPRHDELLIERTPDGRLPFGFNERAYQIGQVSLDEDLGLHRGVGSTMWRWNVDWGAVQPEPEGPLDFEQYDPVYCAAVEAGVRPLIPLIGIPDWATDTVLPCRVPCLRPPDPSTYPALRGFAEQVAIRYPEAVAIEVWNEPNFPTFWRDRPDAARYVEVLREIYTGVKDGNPELPVLGGALANSPKDNPSTGTVSLRTFLETMAENGAGRYMDGVSAHVYPTAPLDSSRQQFDPAMDVVREVAAESEDWPSRIWITEVGIATPPGAAWSPPVSEQAQEKVLGEIYASLDASDDVDAVLWHTLVEPDPAKVPGGTGFGWLALPQDGLEPKLVYCSFARLRQLAPAGC